MSVVQGQEHLETAYRVHCRNWNYCVWSELNKLIKTDCWTDLVCGSLHSWQSKSHPDPESSKETLATIRSHSHTHTLEQSNWTLGRLQKLQVQPKVRIHFFFWKPVDCRARGCVLTDFIKNLLKLPFWFKLTSELIKCDVISVDWNFGFLLYLF